MAENAGNNTFGSQETYLVRKFEILLLHNYLLLIFNETTNLFSHHSD